MTRLPFLIAGAAMLMTLPACEPVPGADGSVPPPTSTARPVTLPESVVAIAAPFQDLSTARIRPEDGCFWYTHQGPVETTELPLRTDAGNPICTRAAN